MLIFVDTIISTVDTVCRYAHIPFTKDGYKYLDLARKQNTFWHKEILNQSQPVWTFIFTTFFFKLSVEKVTKICMKLL